MNPFRRAVVVGIALVGLVLLAEGRASVGRGMSEWAGVGMAFAVAFLAALGLVAVLLAGMTL